MPSRRFVSHALLALAVASALLLLSELHGFIIGFDSREVREDQCMPLCVYRQEYADCMPIGACQ